MNQLQTFPVYLLLTPENAHDYGLEYVSDCILDLEAPGQISSQHWTDLAKGYIFGQAAARMGPHNNVGMYLPIASSKDILDALQDLQPVDWLTYKPDKRQP